MGPQTESVERPVLFSKGWGWSWIRGYHGPDFYYKYGIKEEQKIQNMIGGIIKQPMAVEDTGPFKDLSINLSSSKVIVRLYNGSVQTMFPYSIGIPETYYTNLEFRAWIPIYGEGDCIHSAFGCFNSGTCGFFCFVPDYPKFQGRIKPMEWVKVAVESFPNQIGFKRRIAFFKKMEPKIDSIKDEHGPPHQYMVTGNITNLDNKMALVMSQVPVFLDNKFKERPKDKSFIGLKGKLIGYIKDF